MRTPRKWAQDWVQDPARLLGEVEMEQGLEDREGFIWQKNTGRWGTYTSLPQPPPARLFEEQNRGSILEMGWKTGKETRQRDSTILN